MKEDLTGRIARMYLPGRHGLYPLLEAVSNSIHAIEALSRKDGTIKIQLRRSRAQGRLNTKTDSTEPIEEIVVTDNGIGFTDENMDAFDELDTRYKLKLGGKGIGRLTWLKVFRKVTITSIYRGTNGDYRQRSFDFVLPGGVDNLRDVAVEDAQPCGTEVVLSGPITGYEEMARSRTSTVAAALVKHFTYYLLAEKPPNVEVTDGETTVRALPDDIIDRKTDHFTINNHSFVIEHLKIKSPEKRGHWVHYMGDRRTVKTERLAHLPEVRLRDQEGEFFYQAYVTSPYLDTRVDPLRTSFMIDDNEAELSGVSGSELRTEVNNAAGQYLSSQLEVLRKERDEQVERVIKERLPELRYVSEYNRAEIPVAIPFDANDTEVEEAIGIMHLRNQKTGRQQLATLIEDLQGSTSLNLKSFEDKFGQLDHISRPSQASLASYLLYRRLIINIYRELLKKASDGFQQEAAVHKLLFPMGIDVDTSKAFQQNNLWLLDERLTFANYIASDRPLSEHKMLFDVQSGDEPDVACYFNLGFSEEDPAQGDLRNVVIVEFKRPGPVASKPENPWQQVMRYIEHMQEGTWTEGGGKLKTSNNTRFYCFIVCDLDSRTITRMRREYGFIPVFDGIDGHILYNPELKAYVELVPFERMLRDAERKHRAFFERLGLLP